MKDSYIMLTQDCNNDCLFCSVPKRDIYPSFEELKNKIDKSLKEGYDMFTFTGGEPTLSKDLFKLISYVSSHNKDVRMITNAVDLSEETVNRLIKAGLNYIIFSIHTIDAEKAKYISDNPNYDLEKIFKIGEYILADKSLSLSINTTITKLNYKELPNIVNYVSKRLPFISTMTFNYIDFQGNVVEKDLFNEVAIPYYKAELYMKKAFNILNKNKIDFRVERVPLCYLVGYETKSSDYNRLSQKEALKTNFIDEEQVRDDSVKYNRADCCTICRSYHYCLGVNPIYVKSFGTKDLYPIFHDFKQNKLN
jgi:MoaA/NifB/PqqE/SkfB family radical SAM enzyme